MWKESAQRNWFIFPGASLLYQKLATEPTASDILVLMTTFDLTNLSLGWDKPWETAWFIFYVFPNPSKRVGARSFWMSSGAAFRVASGMQATEKLLVYFQLAALNLLWFAMGCVCVVFDWCHKSPINTFLTIYGVCVYLGNILVSITYFVAGSFRVNQPGDGSVSHNNVPAYIQTSKAWISKAVYVVIIWSHEKAALSIDLGSILKPRTLNRMAWGTKRWHECDTLRPYPTGVANTMFTFFPTFFANRIS